MQTTAACGRVNSLEERLDDWNMLQSSLSLCYKLQVIQTECRLLLL